MSHKVKIALVTVILLWASAFVGIRAGLQHYSPGGLALLRYIVASICMTIVYYRLPVRSRISFYHACSLFLIGALGIGIYNVALNYGELHVTSGTASFIISQSPIVTAIFALLFLGEKLTPLRIVGFIVSVMGVIFIAMGEGGFHWGLGIAYVLLATVVGGGYSILQKPFLKRYPAIETTTFIIWGGTLSLLIYTPELQKDLAVASLNTTLTVIYLGVFPAAMGYLAWSYVLKEMPISRAVSFLYFMPFVAMLMGWLYLNESPEWVSIMGGVLAIFGVGLVNHSYRLGKV